LTTHEFRLVKAYARLKAAEQVGRQALVHLPDRTDREEVRAALESLSDVVHRVGLRIDAATADPVGLRPWE
jgi:hypothetical protein